jgi:hypothetical protein
VGSGVTRPPVDESASPLKYPDSRAESNARQGNFDWDTTGSAVTTAADLGRAEFAAADEGAALRLLMLGSSATAHEGVQCDKNVSQV